MKISSHGLEVSKHRAVRVIFISCLSRKAGSMDRRKGECVCVFCAE